MKPELKNKTEYEIVADTIFNEKIIDSLDGKRILITGASGLIGSQIGKSLILLNKKYNKNVKLLLHDLNENGLNLRYGDELNNKNVELILGDIREPFKYDKEIDFIIHCASATSSQYFVSHPVETIDILIRGTKNILEFAREKNVKSLLYLSSLEVYGDVFDENAKIDENAYHYLDFLNVRSSYSEGKRMCECLCSSYASEYGLPVVIARLAQTIGSDVAYDDKRVFAEFARCAVNGDDIVLKSAGGTIRNYSDIVDSTIAIFYILTKGEKGNAYNVANRETSCSIKEMAETYCRLSEHDIKVKFDLSVDAEKLGYNHEVKINLDPSKLEALGWKPIFSFEDTINKLICGFKNKKH